MKSAQCPFSYKNFQIGNIFKIAGMVQNWLIDWQQRGPRSMAGISSGRWTGVSAGQQVEGGGGGGMLATTYVLSL